MKCAHCNSDFERKARGRAPRFCTEHCRYMAQRDKQLEKYHMSKERGRAWKIAYRQCVVCGKTFCGRKRWAGRVVTCSAACLAELRSRNSKSQTIRHQRTCRHCGELFIGKTHNAVFCTSQCFSSYYRSARIVRKRQVDSEYVSVKVLHNRDGGRCRLCGRLVSLSKHWPDPKSASIDHIIPLSKGGDDTYRNTQLAHLGCNSRKRDSVNGQQLLLIG